MTQQRHSDVYRSVSLVLAGMVVGLGYSVACGSGGENTNHTPLGLPGIGIAMAQPATDCSRWELVRSADVLTRTGATVPRSDLSGLIDTNDVLAVPDGWTPFSDDYLVRCAK